MKFDRFRGAALAASAVLLISGAGTALAGSPAPKSSAGAAATEPAGGVDKDTLQQGDQTSPDLAGAAGKAAPESAAESTTEAPAAPGTETDGPGGHADAAGTVDNQFDGEQ